MRHISTAARGASAYTVAEYDSLGSLALTGPNPEHQQRWDEVIDRLLAARGLDDDWDGQGAVAPDAAVIHRAIRFAQDRARAGVQPPDFAIPTVNGTVVFEWHGSAEYVEYEVVATGQIVRRTAACGNC